MVATCCNPEKQDIYHLVIQRSHGKSQFLKGKPSKNWPFFMPLLNKQRATLATICINL